MRSLNHLALAFEARRKHVAAELVRRQADLQALKTRINDIEASAASTLMLGALGAANAVKWIVRLRSEFDERQASLETLRISLLQLFRRQRLIETLGNAIQHRDRERGKTEIVATVAERLSVSSFAQDMED